MHVHICAQLNVLDFPFSRGDGSDTAAVLPGLKLGIPFFCLVLTDNTHVWELPSHEPGWLEWMLSTLLFSLIPMVVPSEI